MCYDTTQNGDVSNCTETKISFYFNIYSIAQILQYLPPWTFQLVSYEGPEGSSLVPAASCFGDVAPPTQDVHHLVTYVEVRKHANINVATSATSSVNVQASESSPRGS